MSSTPQPIIDKEPIILKIDITIPDDIKDTPKVLCAPKAINNTYMDWDSVIE
jgi:hypothetical protein